MSMDLRRMGMGNESVTVKVCCPMYSFECRKCGINEFGRMREKVLEKVGFLGEMFSLTFFMPASCTRRKVLVRIIGSVIFSKERF